MQLDYCPISDHQCMLDSKLRTFSEDLVELLEGVGAKIILAPVVTGKRVRALDSPVHIIGHMFEERSAIARLKSLEDCADTIK